MAHINEGDDYADVLIKPSYLNWLTYSSYGTFGDHLLCVCVCVCVCVYVCVDRVI